MKIAIIGYGKMGKMIESIARERGDEIGVIIDKDNLEDFDSEAFASCDVAIEFTSPSTAEANCMRALERGVKVVSGSTGWSDRLDVIKNYCDSHQEAAFLWSSNFSIGVNLFMAINAYATRLIERFGGYTPHMTEVHHIHKVDHPSGTAITLAERIIANSDHLKRWSESEGDDSTIVIDHERRGEVPGIHSVTWESRADSITLEHSAKSREGFAMGAVMAAEWLAGQTGYRSIEDFLRI